MNTKKSAALTFTNYYTVKGLYSDGKGNEFNIFVSGEKKDVDRFIRYQKHQLEKGIIGIRAIVTHDSSLQKNTGQKHRRRDTKLEFSSGKVKIGISRHKIVVKRPYRITYSIDPKTFKTDPASVAANAPDFEFEFDNPTADVNCTVQSGSVEFILLEVGKDIARADGPLTLTDTPPQNIGKLAAASSGPIQKWKVQASGKRMGKPSVFVLEYTKIFS